MVVETSGARLNDQGISGLETQLKKVKEAKGGVIFVDEAYQLKDDPTGKKVF